ncbi:MAG TPA: hypothetical protein VGO59_19460 [Verrucomicrobiae bacterium]|jgi:hypothetical protein
MKAPKILLAGLLAVSAAGVAQAQTATLHITGSTAFRSAVQTAILDMLKPGASVAFVGSSYAGASEAIITGTTIGNINGANASVVIKTFWSGSLAGIETVSQQLPLGNFLANSNSTTGGATTALSSPGFDSSDIPEVCMSDGFQLTSQYAPPQYPALTHQNVGAVSFKFIKNKNAPAGLTNMTPLLAQALWHHGSLPLSMWTGNTNDVTNIIYAIGRDPDSGTRKTAFLETGVQTYVSSLSAVTVLQYAPTNANGLVTAKNLGAIISQGAWPAETVDNISFGTGNAGYSSGGDLANAMGQASPFNYVTYLGLSDTVTAESLGATELTYNGVPYSHAAAENGQYTYWTIEQLDYLPLGTGPITANQLALAQLLATQIANENLAGVGESLPSMTVTRSQEGGPVTPGTITASTP